MIRIRIVILHLTGAFRNILTNVLLLLPRCSCLCYVIFWWLVSFEIWFVTSLDYIQNKRNTHLFCVDIILRLLSLNSFCSFYWDFTYSMYLSTLLLLIQCIVKYYKNRPLYIRALYEIENEDYYRIYHLRICFTIKHIASIWFISGLVYD